MIAVHNDMRLALIDELINCVCFFAFSCLVAIGTTPLFATECRQWNIDTANELMNDMEDVLDERASYLPGAAKRCQLEKLVLYRTKRFIEAKISFEECPFSEPSGSINWRDELVKVESMIRKACDWMYQ